MLLLLIGFNQYCYAGSCLDPLIPLTGGCIATEYNGFLFCVEDSD